MNNMVCILEFSCSSSIFTCVQIWECYNFPNCKFSGYKKVF